MAANALPVTRIAELAGKIQLNTQTLDRYFADNGLQSPSFDHEFPTNLPPDVEMARNSILEAADEMHDLMLGPQQLAETMPIRYTSSLGVQAIHRYKLASLVVDDEEVSFAELSRRLGGSPPADELTRLLRQAISTHVFKEPQPGFVAHNAASRYIRDNPPLGDLAFVGYDYMWPASTRALDAIDRWPESGEPNNSGFNIAFNTDEPFFDFLESRPELSKAFANNMKYIQSRPGFANTKNHLIEAFPWDKAKLVVDVGGGLGGSAYHIADSFPSVKCIVQDLPKVVQQAKADVPDQMRGRVEFMEHDFFTEQPVKTADVYFLRTCLHDWSDAKAALILQKLVPAMRPGVQLLLQEFVMPPPGMLSWYHEKTIRCLDVAMKGIFNSKERDLDQWRALFAQVDPRFKFIKSDMAPGQSLALIHFVWEEATD